VTIFQRKFELLSVVVMNSALILMWISHCSYTVLTVHWQMQCIFKTLLAMVWQLPIAILTFSAIISTLW